MGFLPRRPTTLGDSVYGKNPRLKGPSGGPFEIIQARDVNGNLVDIQHHIHGHLFEDLVPPRMATRFVFTSLVRSASSTYRRR